MTDQIPPSLELAGRVAQVTSELFYLAYARVDSNLCIVDVSQNISSVLDEADRDVAGVPLTEAFIEFIGAERSLQSILHNKIPSFKIDLVNRIKPNGSLRYLTFHVLLFDPHHSDLGLLVIFEDVTRFGLTEQNLLQKRNELS